MKNLTISENAQVSNVFSFDFNDLFSKDDVPVTSEILKEQITEITECLNANDKFVSLSFHQRNKGTLFIKVKACTKRVSYQPIITAADEGLVDAVLYAMRGKFNKLNDYKCEEHQAYSSEEKNLVLEYFKIFLSGSKLRVKINNGFTSEQGITYKKYTFHISQNRSVTFYLEDTQELQTLISDIK